MTVGTIEEMIELGIEPQDAPIAVEMETEYQLQVDEIDYRKELKEYRKSYAYWTKWNYPKIFCDRTKEWIAKLELMTEYY